MRKEKTNIESLNDKVFFIVSNETHLDNKINYSISKSKGINNFNNVLTIKNYKNTLFTIYVFYFEINPKKLSDKDEQSQKYKAKIILNYNSTKFEGIIMFKGKGNNYIYDLKFNDHDGLIHYKKPPFALSYSKLTQFKIFKETLEKMHVNREERLYQNLIEDFESYIIDKNEFKFIYYLETLFSYFSQEKFSNLLMLFKPNDYNMTFEGENDKLYSSIFSVIENNPEVILNHCSDKYNKKNYLIAFYNLLLYYRMIYEKEKVQEVLTNKNLREYYAEILPLNKYCSWDKFSSVSDELVVEMLKQDYILGIDNIKNILNYSCSVEKCLFIISNNCDIIEKYYKKDGKQILVSQISLINDFLKNKLKKEKLNNILLYIEKIVNYQLNNKKEFIVFDHNFWELMIDLYNNFQNLVYIYSILKKISYDLIIEQLNIKSRIVCCPSLGELQNEKLIEFIDNEYSILKDFDLQDIVNRGIDLDKINDKFFEKWNKSTYFKYKYQERIINQINCMNFELLFKLFDYKDPKFYDKNICSLLCNRFQAFVYPNIIYQKYSLNIKNVSLFIYILDKRYDQIQNIMKNTIEKIIYSVETLSEIYMDLFSNYKDISQDVKDRISNYFIENINYINEKSILFLFQKINSNNINKKIIKEEDLFTPETQIESFIFLKIILDKGINIKYPDIYETNYFKSIIEISNKIFNIIKAGEIKFSLVNSILEGKSKYMLVDKLSIIFLNDTKKVEICLKELNERYFKILGIFENIKKLLIVIKNCYETKHKNDIKTIVNLEKEIKEGMLNDIEKIEMKNKIDVIYKMIPNINKKYLLINSKFFSIFLDIQKVKISPIDEDKIFNAAEESFKKLKNIFNNNWTNIIDQSVIKECFKAIYFMNDNQILYELQLLRLYFELNEINDLFLYKLINEIKIIKDKDIFSIKQNNNNDNNFNNSVLNNEIINLKNDLNYKDKIIEFQNLTIKNLQKQINDLNTLNDNKQSFIINLENNQELRTLKNKSKDLNEELSKLNLKKDNKNNKNNIDDNEITIAINFISSDQEINYHISCKINDTIAKLEEQLYNEYPKYKDYDTFLTTNGKIVKRLKTIEENEITNDNTILINIYE